MVSHSSASPDPTQGEPRKLLWAWAESTFVTTTSLIVYLPLSTQPAFEQISEHPTPLVLLWVTCGLVSLATLPVGRRRGAFPPSVRAPMIGGTSLGLLLVGFSLFYIYSLSSGLPSPDGAPQSGDMVPEFVVATPEGRTWNLSQPPLQGRTVLLVFYRGNW